MEENGSPCSLQCVVVVSIFIIVVIAIFIIIAQMEWNGVSIQRPPSTLRNRRHPRILGRLFVCSCPCRHLVGPSTSVDCPCPPSKKSIRYFPPAVAVAAARHVVVVVAAIKCVEFPRHLVCVDGRQPLGVPLVVAVVFVPPCIVVRHAPRSNDCATSN